MPLRFLIILSSLLASCGENSPVTPPPAGQNLSDLPTATLARELSEEEAGFIEVVISSRGLDFFHDTKPISNSPREEAFHEKITAIRQSNEKKNFGTPLLISAPASTPYGEIRKTIRTAAAAGLHRIIFLVRSETTSNTGIIPLDLPTVGHPPPTIEPYFLHINHEDRIFSGAGPNRSPMDDNGRDRELTHLSSQLELFATAANSAGVGIAPCLIYVNPEASYQRTIDLLTAIKKWGLSPYLTDIIPPPPQKPEKIQRKPSPPNSNLQKVIPLGLAPKSNP